MSKKLVTSLVFGVFIMTSAAFAEASTVAWTDWTSAASSAVYGVLTVGADTVNVTFSGEYAIAQTSGGTNYWIPSSPYTSAAVENPPSTTDIIALNNGGVKTITFSTTVQDPVLALVSWNSNVVDFGVPIEILSYSPGYWGFGTPVLNATGTGFYGAGEVHCAIRLLGAYDSITFTDTSEYWHGLTVGVTGLATNPVPIPSAFLLISSGLASLIGFKRKYLR